MIMSLFLFALPAHAESPDWSSLSADDWSEVGTRRSEVGAIDIRAKYVDAIGCVEGTVRVDASPEALLAITADMASAPDWSSATLSASEVVERDAGSFVLFQVLDVPGWTLANDRFWTIRGEPVSLESGATRYRWSRVDSGAYPRVAEVVDDRAIEPPTNYGEWLFTPTDAGATDLRYRACADFGGRVPTPIQRWINTQQVPALVSELVQEAQRRTAL
jgi:hypothetical protein